MYPNLFLWQENFIIQALGYDPQGSRVNLVSRLDLISDDNYWRLSGRLSRYATNILPEWITVAVTKSVFEDAFPGDDAILPSVHTMIGCPSQIDGYPPFTAEPNTAGFLLYGPYVQLEAGSYEVRFVVQREPKPAAPSAELIIDALSSVGPLCDPRAVPLRELPPGEWHTIVLPFRAPAALEKVETRVFLPAITECRISIIASVAIKKLL